MPCDNVTLRIVQLECNFELMLIVGVGIYLHLNRNIFDWPRT